MWEWKFAGQMIGDRLVINERPRNGGDKHTAIHVINPKKEYPHPIHYLIEPVPEMNRANVPIAHDRYLGAR